MRKITTYFLLFTFTLAAFSPLFGQRVNEGKSDRRQVSIAQFETVRALTDGAGVLIRWQMKAERDIAVYYVYRLSDGGKEMISPIPVPGSAGRYGKELARGEVYNFFDIDGTPEAQYTIEGLSRDGRRFYSVVAVTKAVSSVEAEVGISSETFRNARLSTNSDVQRNAATLTGDLLDFVSLYMQEPDPEMQRIIASQSGAKIAVKKDGFYRVTAAELQAAGFPINSDSSKWRLFMNGNEQAITVGPNSEYFDFYGRGIDTPDTDTRQYYLVADTVPGKRIATKVLRQRPGAAEATRFRVDAGKKERNFYENRLFNYEEENFFGRFLNDVPTRINFNITGVDTSASARIKVTLVGFTENNHRFTVKLNGHTLPDITQFGRVSMWTQVDIPGTHLLEGSNEIELASSSFADQALFDRVEVTYQKKYLADQSRLSFTTPGDRKIDIDGFSTSAVRVYDLSFDGNPVQIVNIPVIEEQNGFSVKLPSSRPMVGYAVEDSGMLQSPAVVNNLPSSLSATTNSAEMLIISHSSPSFMNEAQAWASYRESEAGGRIVSKTIDVADIYDEFSFGEIKHDAIKTFLKYAKEEWATEPTYVLLIGDATYDPRNYEGYGFNNLIPSYPTRFIIEESFSDDALVDFDDDGLTDLTIGRIPARTSAQISTARLKMQRYEQNQLNFDRGSLFAYDSAFDFDFEGMSQIIASELPASAPREFIVAGTPTSNSSLIASMNQGKTFINYSGHGAAGLWSSTNFFSIADVSSLTNTNNPSFYSMLTCMNGFFLRTNAESLSEALLFHPGGGAAAAWASTSLTTPDVQLIMAQRFVRKMSASTPGNIERLGPLIRDAKTVIAHGADVRLSWVLIGDPAMKTP